MMCKVYTDVGGIVRKIIHSLKLVDYLHVQADKPWYNYYLINVWCQKECVESKLDGQTGGLTQFLKMRTCVSCKISIPSCKYIVVRPDFFY